MPATQRESRVRKASPGDARGILNLFTNAFSPALLRYTIYRSLAVESYLKAYINSPPPGWVLFLIEQENEVLGAYIAQERSEGWFLNYIAVTLHKEGRGIGGQLLEHFEQEGRRRGAKKALLDVFESNSRALTWYYSKGYELIRRSFFIAISIREAAIFRGPDLVVDDKEWRRALDEEQRRGFSNVDGFCHKGSMKVGLIAGDTLRLMSWEGLSLQEAAGAIARRLGNGREELVILSLPRLPSGLPLISQEAVLRLSRKLISCKDVS